MVGQASSRFKSPAGSGDVGNAGEGKGAHGLQIGRLARFALINRRFVGQFLGGNVRHHLAVDV